MSKPLGATTYMIDADEFAGFTQTEGRTVSEVGYLFVSTNANGDQEQRWVLQSWSDPSGNSHKFLSPPRRSAGMRLRPVPLTYMLGEVQKTVTNLATWVEFANSKFNASTSAYVKVATKLKTYSDFTSLPSSFSGSYPDYMQPDPPTASVLPQQIDIGALILRFQDEETEKWWSVGFAHGSPDNSGGANRSREHWILFPDGTDGGPALTHGLRWPYDGKLRIGGANLGLDELSSLMNTKPWQSGSTLVLASCTYYNYVADA